jgi:hypothetical protein
VLHGSTQPFTLVSQPNPFATTGTAKNAQLQPFRGSLQTALLSQALQSEFGEDVHGHSVRAVRLLSQYVRWVDDNLDGAVLNIRGASSLVAFIPLGLVGMLDYAFRPIGSQRTVLFVVGCSVAAFFCGIWVWRILVALFGNPSN